jgi:hypothetical protein
MHRVTLLADQKFPSCRECENQVRFEWRHSIRESEGFTFHSGEVLKEYSDELRKPPKMAE